MSYSHEPPHPQHQGSYGPQPTQTQGQNPNVYAQQTGNGYPQQLQQPMVQQPGLQQPMRSPYAGAINPNPLAKPVDAQGERDWNHGLCSCTDKCGTCCMACWCPCITYGETATRIEALQLTGQPHPNGGDACGVPTLLFLAINWFTGCAWIMTCVQRGSIRKRYHVKGNSCTDCLVACFCHPCGQTQMAREVEDEEQAITGGVNGGNQFQTQQPQQQPQPQAQPQPQQHHSYGEKTPAYSGQQQSGPKV